MHFIVFLIVGLIAGWLAQVIMKGRGGGLVINLIVGIIGSYLGGWLLGHLGFAIHGIIGWIITATIGAVVLLFLVGLIKKA
jgi:uncharacterized membrane protein YeaQ/YmgE (transglycosylase-associated protein family)